ncbi:MAG: hypothetical protein KAS52_02405, partial [Candidatus Heimdallarchaeota archaeon]|nr:hypothetical protein [Candidatus Heimdallarchaeota archaeon]
KYTLNTEKCPSCGGRVVSPRPAKFSIEKEKKYSSYRRQLIKNDLNTS